VSVSLAPTVTAPGQRLSPAAEAARVVDAVLADLAAGDHRGVVVDSPPGAGKSTLVVRAAQMLAATREPLMLVAQTNEQVDDLISRLAAATGWGLHELPSRCTVRTDAEAAAACAALASRALSRTPVAVSESGTAELTPDRIAIGAAHRDQVAAIRSYLPPSAAGVTVDTANRLQGREYDLTVVLHPLSGRQDATAFHLESGRLCVLTSRHRHACVVVARAGIAELLDAHPSAEPVHLNVPVKFPDGWEANQSMLAHLAAG
jgi:hypothetical protein